MKPRQIILIGVQILAAVLFLIHVRTNTSIWISWAVPLALILMIVINSVWTTRFLSWVIFAGSFFCFLVLLSAFTLRWRLEQGFSAIPFYRAILMYVAFIYVSLGQLKKLGGSVVKKTGIHEGEK